MWPEEQDPDPGTHAVIFRPDLAGEREKHQMRQLTGLLLSALLLAGCASNPVPGPQDSGFYHAPARAYSLALDSAVFRGRVTLTEQCDARGGTLNIWDGSNNFFRIDYLRIGQHPMADVPSFASERTVDEQVLNNYLREVLPNASGIQNSVSLLSDYVDTGRGSGMFAVVSMTMKDKSLPEFVTSTNFYYGLLVFTKGDFVYVLQHRVDTYQPDNLKQVLSNLRQDMLVPGAPRAPVAPADGKGDKAGIPARCG
jgi:hypothetical protein